MKPLPRETEFTTGVVFVAGAGVSPRALDLDL